LFLIRSSLINIFGTLIVPIHGKNFSLYFTAKFVTIFTRLVMSSE